MSSIDICNFFHILSSLMVMKLLQMNLVTYGKQDLYNRQTRNALHIELLFTEHPPIQILLMREKYS